MVGFHQFASVHANKFRNLPDWEKEEHHGSPMLSYSPCPCSWQRETERNSHTQASLLSARSQLGKGQYGLFCNGGRPNCKAQPCLLPLHTAEIMQRKRERNFLQPPRPPLHRFMFQGGLHVKGAPLEHNPRGRRQPGG